MIIPIRTESPIKRPPNVNYALIAANVVMFLLLNMELVGPGLAERGNELLQFWSGEPALYQFFTYQFLHGDAWHLLGNMLFLWVFGNSVNAKMGDWTYLAFYLAGGIFAAWGYAVTQEGRFVLVGASGSIAAITTAYLVLFPRSRVTVLVALFFIYFFEVPAMVIIGVKIIIWDNIIAPGIGGRGNVAHGAHMAGYFMGFFGALIMLWIRALPRDQYDLLALWKRWSHRRQFASAMRDPEAAAQARFGSAARVPAAGSKEREAENLQLDAVSTLRAEITSLLGRGDQAAAAQAYERLIAQDADQCLSERNQLLLARELYTTHRYPQAAAAFERYLKAYGGSPEAADIQLLLGIIYARDLREFEHADRHLTASLEVLVEGSRREQCVQWLGDVRTALGKPAPNS